MFHFMQYRQAAQYAQMYNVPLAEPGVLLTGALAVAGGVMVGLGLWGDLGQQWQLQLTNFQKNNGLLGGALVIFYVWTSCRETRGSL
jgi:hypothetical protein